MMILKRLTFDFKLKILCPILFIFFNLSIGQNADLDFVESYYTLLSKDKEKAISYCNELIRSKQYQKKAFGLAGKAHVNTKKAAYEKAATLFMESKAVLEKYNVKIDKEIASNILYLESSLYTEKLDFDKALTLLSAAIDRCNNECSFVLKSKLESAQARIYSMSKNKFISLQKCRTSLQRIKNHPDFATSYELRKEYLKELARASSRSTNIYITDREKYKTYLDSTAKYTLLAKDFATQNNIHDYDNFIEVYFADMEFYQDKFDSAITHYKEALQLFKAKNNNKKVAQMRYQIARCNYELGELQLAEDIFKEQLDEDIWSKYPMLDNNAYVYDYLSKIYKQRGDLETAMAYAEDYIKNYQVFLAEKNSSDLNVNDKMHFEERKREVEGFRKKEAEQAARQKMYTYALIISVIIIVSLIAFFVNRQKKTKENISKLNERLEWLQQNVSTKTNFSKSSSLSDENALKLIEKLKDLEKEELFIDPSYSLNMMAKKLHTNSSYLSKTVNDYMNLSFVEYSNRLKVNYIVQKLNSKKSLRNYTIEALAKEAGYKSVNSFNTNFKKLLKVTPSQYLKNLEA